MAFRLTLVKAGQLGRVTNLSALAELELQHLDRWPDQRGLLVLAYNVNVPPDTTPQDVGACVLIGFHFLASLVMVMVNPTPKRCISAMKALMSGLRVAGVSGSGVSVRGVLTRTAPSTA